MQYIDSDLPCFLFLLDIEKTRKSKWSIYENAYCKLYDYLSFRYEGTYGSFSEITWKVP